MTKRKKLINKVAGFTIVEMLIATAVFSVVLLLCSVGVLQVGKMYYKGVVSSKTQEAARNIMAEISDNIQLSGGAVGEASGESSSKAFCIGHNRYSYVLGQAVKDSPNPAEQQFRHVLVADTSAACSTPQDLNATSLTAGSRDLVPEDMWLLGFEVEPLNDNLYRVWLQVGSGPSDLFDRSPDRITCRSGFNLGSQFCAVSEMETVVQKRIGD